MRYRVVAVTNFKIKFGGRTLALPVGTHLVGRMQDCWLILDDDLTSRYHARLYVSDAAVELEDLDSSNGTFLNGKRVAARNRLELKHGDSVRIGREVIAILSDASTGSSDDPMDSLRKTIGPHEDNQFPALISQLVQKSLNMGKIKEAERYALALTNQLMGAQVPGDHPTARVAINSLIQLAAKSASGVWLDRVFRLHAVHRWLMSDDIIAALRGALDRITRIPGTGLEDYERTLRELSREGVDVPRHLMSTIAEFSDAYGGP
jgi:pSer/pThr/pTyr-binding forkhead associated (FHA) protein